MNKFRSIDFWKASIMTLPDNAFFELLRTVLGKIKTPFNKQMLMSDLEKFLLRKNIQQNIAAYINDNDIRIITAVAALNEPAPGDLETFFSGELSYVELYDTVINLEERFILYRFFEKDKGSRLALNPVLKSILSPHIEDISVLFPSVSIKEIAHNKTTPERPQFFLDDRMLAALLSFVSQNELFFRGDGIRQKTLNAAKLVFPDLPMDTAISCLQALGLFEAKDETLVPDYQRFFSFGNLNRQNRLIYCAASMWCCNYSLEGMSPAAISPWLLRAKIHSYAKIINHLYNALEPERLYPPTTLQKLAYMQWLNYPENENIKNYDIINIAEKIGLIVPASNGYWQKKPITENSLKKSADIAMDTPFTLLVYPEIAYNDAIALAAFSNVIEAGVTVRFEISRDSAVQAFNRGLSANTIIELLQRLSHNRIDENLIFTLRDWEKRHGEVTLRQGVVLTLAPEQRHLAETKPLARLITETLAPGIYMLGESTEEKAAEALRKAGVTIIARRGARTADESLSGTLRNFFQPLPDEHSKDKHSFAISQDTQQTNAASAAALIDQFHSILNQSQYGKEERAELTARIDRRLVLCESQLKDAVIRYEKLEARGLDYVGKATIAKQAIALQAPVEVILPGKKKQHDHIFGIPKALEKAGSESILILDSLDGEDTLRFSLGKISLLRRIKKSIFENVI